MLNVIGSESIPKFVGTAQIYLSPTNGSKPLSMDDLESSVIKSPKKVSGKYTELNLIHITGCLLMKQ